MEQITPSRELPRLGILREMTDQTVMAEVFERGRVTRAEVSVRTGISKPTLSQSVRRLEEANLLRAAGADTGRRGRLATFYELAPDAGWVLGVQIDQTGLRARSTDLMGEIIFEKGFLPGPSGDPAALIALLRRATLEALAAVGSRGPLRAGTISVANPVDPATNHIIAMPDAPFLEGEAPLKDVLADIISAPLMIDNDVNLAARAERQRGAARGLDNFAYVYVGAGMGMGLYVGGRSVRGAHGLAGEIGELASAGRPATLARALHQSGFGAQGGPSVLVDAVLAVLAAVNDGKPPPSIRKMAAVVAQAIAATCAILDPELFVVGGSIGGHPAMQEPIRAAVADIWPGPVRIEPSTAGDLPALQGAVLQSLGVGRSALLSSIA